MILAYADQLCSRFQFVFEKVAEIASYGRKKKCITFGQALISFWRSIYLWDAKSDRKFKVIRINSA